MCTGHYQCVLVPEIMIKRETSAGGLIFLQNSGPVDVSAPCRPRCWYNSISEQPTEGARINRMVTSFFNIVEVNVYLDVYSIVFNCFVSRLPTLLKYFASVFYHSRVTLLENFTRATNGSHVILQTERTALSH